MEVQARRKFIVAGILSSSALIVGTPSLSWAKEEADVGPAEDLMREHGGLNRILLIYEEGVRRLRGKADFDPSFLKKSATLIRTFIEDYHEKLEEEFIFPKMRKIAALKNTVDTLDTQHKAGRKLTTVIEGLADSAKMKNQSDREKLILSIESFVRMYRPHESREDTIIFPAFHEGMKEKEYDELGEKFEDREHKLFGKEGFKGVISQIEELEKGAGIYDLAQFTPKV